MASDRGPRGARLGTLRASTRNPTSKEHPVSFLRKTPAFRLAPVLAAGVLALGAAACDADDADDAGDEIEDTVDDAGDELEEGFEDLTEDDDADADVDADAEADVDADS
jgi:hypothetical protein